MVFFIERLIGWYSINRFELKTYETRIDVTEASGYTTDNFNFKSAQFEYMIGFDRILPQEIGRIETTLATYGSDGKVTDLELLTTVDCD